MSDDRIRLVRSLIDLKVGDAERLQRILAELEQGANLLPSDEDYLQLFSGKDQPAPEPPHEGRDSAVEAAGGQTAEESTAESEADIHGNYASRKKVAIIASIIAAVVLAYVVLDAYSVSMLEFRPHPGSQYQVSPTEVHIEADVCNPSIFPATFGRYEIVAFYNSEMIERADIDGTTVSPKSMSTLEGVFALNMDAVQRLSQENATFNPALARITTTVDAPILGAIPFSVQKQYSAEQFQEVLRNGPPGTFSC